MSPIVVVAIITVAAVALLVTQVLRPAVVALLIWLAVYATGLVPAGSLFNSLVNSSTLLILFMFIICETATAVGIPQRIGRVLLRFAKTERSAVMVVLIISLILSSFLGNMAVAVMVVPIAIGMCNANPSYAKGKLLMATAFGSITGGFNTLIGNVGNSMTRAILLEQGYDIGFWGFGKIGLPLSIVMILVIFFFGNKILPNSSDIPESRIVEESKTEAAPRWKLAVTSVVFHVVIVGMMLESYIGIPVHIVAMIGAIVLLATRVIKAEEAFRAVNWSTIIFFAGLLTLSSAITSSGAADLVARWVVDILNGQTNTYWIYVVIFVVICVATQLISNGALMSIMFPIAISIAKQLNFDPVAIVMLVTVSASCSFMTPMATPLNAYIMGVGNFKMADFAKPGIVITILFGIVSIVMLPIIWPV